MRKVYIDNIPKIQTNKNYGKIDWNKSVGMKIKFVFDDVNGMFQITSYNKNILTIKFNDVSFDITTGNLIKCKFGQKIGKINYKNWLFDEGQCIENIYILKRFYNDKSQRCYKYKCLVCGNIDTKTEYCIKNNKILCNVCSGHKLRIGYNDLYTKHPELVDRFPGGKTQMEKFFPYSREKIKGRCPYCGNISSRYSTVQNIVNYGVYCDCKCGRSYGEKYFTNILNQMNIEFEEECSVVFDSTEFAGSRVDFLINSLNLIVEIDGEIGHGNSNPFNVLNKDKGLDNDIRRDEYLCSAKYTVIRIPYKSRNFEELKQNIINKLSGYFDFSNIDFSLAECFALGDVLSDICNYYNKTLSVKDTANKFHYSQTTIVKYLKTGYRKGLTYYSANENIKKGYDNLVPNKSKPVIRYSKNESVYYNSAKLAAEDIGVKTSTITAVARGEKKTAKGYKFAYAV